MKVMDSNFPQSESSDSTTPVSPPLAQNSGLTYEETPIIEPIKETTFSSASNATPDSAPMPSSNDSVRTTGGKPFKEKGRLGKFISQIFILGALFVLGLWLSNVLRPYLPFNIPSLPKPETLWPKVSVVKTPTPPSIPSVAPQVSWKTYGVISGTLGSPIPGITFKMPSDVLEPICDGTGCVSQGTYLPGGSRFTVAGRGVGQTLKDYRGAIITDVSGKAFTTKETSVAGHVGLEFTGAFTGTTVSGYAFSQMRGVMVAVNDSISLEINHFIPLGINADFVADDTLFDKILTTLEIVAQPVGVPAQEKGGLLSTPSPLASPSGY